MDIIHWSGWDGYGVGWVGKTTETLFICRNTIEKIKKYERNIKELFVMRWKICSRFLLPQ